MSLRGLPRAKPLDHPDGALTGIDVSAADATGDVRPGFRDKSTTPEVLPSAACRQVGFRGRNYVRGRDPRCG